MATRRKPPAQKRGATTSRRRKADPAPRRRLPGWVWGLAGLVAGFFLAQHQHGTAPWQQGEDSPLATLLSRLSPGSDAPSSSPEPVPASPEEPPMPTFEFYTLLPESEVIAPGGEATTSPSPTSTPPARERPETADPIARVIAANSRDGARAAPAGDAANGEGRYMLQAASFRDAGDARQLAGRLKDFGLLAKISEVQASGGDTWHRVQVGPYLDRRELSRAQDLMVTQGIEPLLIRLQ